MNYIEFRISGQTTTLNDILIAQLSTVDFNGFLEEENQLVAYIEEAAYLAPAKALLEALKAQHQLNITTKIIAEQNWNAQWEADYQPVVVEDFCAVRASFHPPINTVQHELIVTPKMSFGTGHHATTYMMMLQMRDLVFSNQKVLDYGCGTGVLAILSKRLGAQHLDAVDIDYWSYDNTLENRELNGVEASEMQVYHGVLADVPTQQYDLILANINRNVILETMPEMCTRLKNGGKLLCSGFLEQDIPLVVAAAQEQGLHLQRQEAREKWRCLLFSH
ncbi:MAG: 50S ribosomal protein L11 methyltransferase [Aureispira sp.]